MWSRVLLTGAVLAGLVYAMVVGVNWLTPQIESDIADRVTTALAEKGQLWAEPQVVGREVVVRGEAPNEEAKAEALKIVKGVFGVAEVSDMMVLASPSNVVAGKASSAYGLTIEKQGDKVTLRGQVPDEATRDVLVRVATTHYGARNVNAEELTLAPEAPAGWRVAAGALLMHIANLEQATVSLSGTEVMLNGQVLDAQFATDMETQVRAVLPKNYKLALAMEVVTPTTPAPAAAEVEPAAGPADQPVSGEACAEATLDTQLAKQVVRFDFDKAEIRADQRGVIDAVADQMKPCAAMPLVIAGYTDATGSPLYNQWLSEQRAQAAQRALMRQGVAKERITAVGYGENHPVATNSTREGRAQNRRVEFGAGTELPHALPVGAKGAVSPTTAESASPTSAIAKPWWARVGALLDGEEASPTADLPAYNTSVSPSVSPSVVPLTTR